MKTQSLALLLTAAFATRAADTEPSIQRDMDALRAEALRSPRAEACRIAVAAAETAYDDALAAIPGVREVDREMQGLQGRMRELSKRRADLETAHAAALAPLRQARDEAWRDLRETLNGGTAGVRLADRMAALTANPSLSAALRAALQTNETLRALAPEGR